MAPASAIGMTVGTDIPEVDPAVVRTRGMGAEVTGRIDLAATPTGECECGVAARRAAADETQLLAHRARTPACAYTQQMVWVHACAASVAAALALGCAATPTPMGQENQEDEEYTGDEIERQVGSHHQPFRLGNR